MPLVADHQVAAHSTTSSDQRHAGRNTHAHRGKKMADENIASTSSFVFVEKPSSWIFVPDPSAHAEAQMSEASRVRWRDLADAQSATAQAARQCELQRLLGAQKIRGLGTFSTDSDTNASFLPPEAAEALKIALDAELASARRREQQLQLDAAAALDLHSAATRSVPVAGPPHGMEPLRRCDCLGASASIHRLDCPYAAPRGSDGA